MSVHVHLIGRFGNNLFQIALGRIIAEKTGYQFSLAQENKDLRETYGLPLDYLDTKFENQEFLPNCQSFIPGKVAVGEPVLINEYNYDSVDQIIDFANGRPIILHGFFQRWKYCLPYREKLREWFGGPKETVMRTALHIRREDYPETCRLPGEYYRAMVEKTPAPHWFMGKDMTLRMLMDFASAGGNHLDMDSISVFRFIQESSHIVCANSSFSWMAAFLSHAERVFIPQPSNPKAYWSAESNQDLCAPIEGWERIEC